MALKNLDEKHTQANKNLPSSPLRHFGPYENARALMSMQQNASTPILFAFRRLDRLIQSSLRHPWKLPCFRMGEREHLSSASCCLHCFVGLSSIGKAKRKTQKSYKIFINPKRLNASISATAAGNLGQTSGSRLAAASSFQRFPIHGQVSVQLARTCKDLQEPARSGECLTG